MSKLQPMLLATLKDYSKAQFIKDLFAGIIVSIIALPLSIAIAIASGASPEQGLYAAIIGGFLISFLGGSRVQIGGPSATFLIVVFGVMIKYGLNGVIFATMLAGIILILFGLFGLGGVIKYIPYPITTGFTSGVAVIIFSSQIKDFFGLTIGKVPAEFLPKWILYFENFNTINLTTLFIGILALLIIIIWPRINRRIPSYLIAIIITTLITTIFKLNIATIGSSFSNIQAKLPTPELPKFNTFTEFIRLTQKLIGPAFSIAIIASIESLLSAVVSDGMIGTKHRSNMELVAQGCANFASGLFGGIPVTGALARTVANIKNGGKTPISGIIHALTLLVILLTLMPLVKLIPLTTLAAILIIVSYNMSGWREFKSIFSGPKSDISVLLITFLITVFIDVVQAIEIGMIFSALLFIKRMADVSNTKRIKLDASEEIENEEFDIVSVHIPSHVEVYEINGPFFFGAADKFIETVNRFNKPTRLIILRMRNVSAMDATALHAFKQFIDLCAKNHITLLVSGINPQPLKALKKANFYEIIGEKHFFNTYNEAVRFVNDNR